MNSKESDFHLLFINDTILKGGVKALIACGLFSKDSETRDQAFWAIGNIAVDCEQCRSKVRQSGALNALTALFQKPDFMSSKHKRNTIWALSQIVRGGIQPLLRGVSIALFQGLHKILCMEDPLLRTDATWSIAYITENVINGGGEVETILQTPNLVRRLIELLYDDEAMHPALLALGNLVTGEEDDTQRVLNAGLLSHLVRLYRTKEGSNIFRCEIIWILSNIAAGSQAQVDLLFGIDDIDKILIEGISSNDSRMKKECSWTIVNALRNASVQRLEWLCCTCLPSAIPVIFAFTKERYLIERALFAIENILVEKRNYLPAFQQLGIINCVRSIESDANSSIGFFAKVFESNFLLPEM
ncbi:unnamed protein product [Dracunculus medinensis]|uniref:Importin subunit alpha n=1 Tax=Dracunculus medinensis TaxID=318479 RepID=A0A0N4UF09_DRAME|nr:unnamed protein product [Dracunculus medinensis]